MNKDTIVYLPVEINGNDLPLVHDRYWVLLNSRERDMAWYHPDDNTWETYSDEEITHWLKPLTVEALLKELKGNDVTSDSKASAPVVSLPCTSSNSIEQ